MQRPSTPDSACEKITFGMALAVNTTLNIKKKYPFFILITCFYKLK